MATRRTTIGAAAVGLALLLAACGSDDGNSTIEGDGELYVDLGSSTTTAALSGTDDLDPDAPATSP